MADFMDYTWTVDTLSDDSSKVYAIGSIGPELNSAVKYEKYNLVIYLNSEELYQGGKGTLNDPYIIKQNILTKNKYDYIIKVVQEEEI